MGSSHAPKSFPSFLAHLSPSHNYCSTRSLLLYSNPPTHPMATVSPSEMAATRIPKITDLRDQLHYGDARLLRCSAFSDDLRVFRRRYSSKGIRGADLWDWKSSEHQAALNDMTANFLDDQSYGELYWPSDPTSPNFNSLQYSEDRAL
jgi:hypothetical protein